MAKINPTKLRDLNRQLCLLLVEIREYRNEDVLYNFERMQGYSYWEIERNMKGYQWAKKQYIETSKVLHRMYKRFSKINDQRKKYRLAPIVKQSKIIFNEPGR